MSEIAAFKKLMLISPTVSNIPDLISLQLSVFNIVIISYIWKVAFNYKLDPHSCRVLYRLQISSKRAVFCFAFGRPFQRSCSKSQFPLPSYTSVLEFLLNQKVTSLGNWLPFSSSRSQKLSAKSEEPIQDGLLFLHNHLAL